MALRKTYYPTKTFDDELDALARLCQAKGWDFPGIGLEQILADAEAQRTERAAHDALVSQALEWVLEIPVLFPKASVIG